MAAWSELRQSLEVEKPATAPDSQKQGTSPQAPEAECTTGCNTEDDEDEQDTYSSYFFRRNYIVDGMTDTTDTDGIDRTTTYFPSAARLRKRIVKRFEEFRNAGEGSVR